MSGQQFASALEALRISPESAALFLSVHRRSVQRWLDGEEVPGPVEAAIRAWQALDRMRLPWKPDTESVLSEDEDQIRLHLKHGMDLADLIARVSARGGPRNSWSVDLRGGVARCGDFEVDFYRLRNHGFSLAGYRRNSQAPNWHRDASYIEDAAFAISQAYENEADAREALVAVADYLRNLPTTIRIGQSDTDDAARRRNVHSIADKVDDLVSAPLGEETWLRFEVLLGMLHRVRVFPPNDLIGAVARSQINAVQE
jgi:hypothetical protein